MRAYRRGDPLKLVVWKKAAKSDELVSRDTPAGAAPRALARLRAGRPRRRRGAPRRAWPPGCCRPTGWALDYGLRAARAAAAARQRRGAQAPLPGGAGRCADARAPACAAPAARRARHAVPAAGDRLDRAAAGRATCRWWCSALTAVVLVWRGTLAVRGAPLPRHAGGCWPCWLLTLAATCATHRTLLGRDAGVTLIVVLLALKTLELRARRDAFVVFFLGFFTMLTNFFFSQSLRDGGGDAAGAAGPAHRAGQRPHAGGPAAAGAGGAHGRLDGAAGRADHGWCCSCCSRAWRRCGAFPATRMTGRSGLSATMQVGNVAQLALDDGIAAARPLRGHAAAAAPTLYFRGPVLSTFDGREWRPLLPRLARSAAPAAADRARAVGAPVRYEVTLEPNNRPWLLVLDAAPQAARGARAARLLHDARPAVDRQPARRPTCCATAPRATPQFRSGPQRRAAGAAASTCSCRPASTRARSQLARADAARPALAGADTPALVQAALRPPAHRRLHLHAGARASTATTPPTSSGSTARRASASTSPRPSWC